MLKITKSMTDKLPLVLNRGYSRVEIRVVGDRLVLSLEKDKKEIEFEFSRNYDFHKKFNQIIG